MLIGCDGEKRNAASTFNLLAEEGRRVGAALCPLTAIDPRTGVRREAGQVTGSKG